MLSNLSDNAASSSSTTNKKKRKPFRREESPFDLKNSNINRSPSTSSSKQGSHNTIIIDCDDTLSKRITDISMEDREYGNYDLHGIADATSIEETPDFILQKMNELTNLLLSAVVKDMPSEKTLGFREAMSISPQYVEELKVNFLRVSNYIPRKASSRMIRFFKHKLELFGKSRLCQTITQDDLDDATKDALDQGVCQVMSQRDRTGRAVLVFSQKQNVIHGIQPSLRAMYYVIMSMLQDKETQTTGIVIVWDAIGQSKFKGCRTYWQTYVSMPTCLKGFHWVSDYSPSIFNPLSWADACKGVIRHSMLSRCRFHHGTYMEIIYSLMTFGIPQEGIPMMEDGSLDLNNHHRMLTILRCIEKQRRAKLQNVVKVEEDETEIHHTVQQEQQEEIQPAAEPLSSSSGDVVIESTMPSNDKMVDSSDDGGAEDEQDISNTILIPSPMDVLLGRGRQPGSRPGSLKMLHLVQESMEEYELADKFEKTVIAETVLREMSEAGCRFLIEAPILGGYVEVDHIAARKKVAHVFRNQRRNIYKKSNNNNGVRVEKRQHMSQ